MQPAVLRADGAALHPSDCGPSHSGVTIGEHSSSRRDTVARRGLTFGWGVASLSITGVAASIYAVASGFELLRFDSPVGTLHLNLAIFALVSLFVLRKFKPTFSWQSAAVAALVLCFVPSIVWSQSTTRSVAMVIRIAMVYGLIGLPLSVLYRRAPSQTITGLISAYRVQILIAALMWVVRFQPAGNIDTGGSRIFLLYYEPSYLAFGFAPFLVWASLQYVYCDRDPRNVFWTIADSVLVVTLLAVTQSAMVALAAVIAFGSAAIAIRRAGGLALCRYAAATALAVTMVIGYAIRADEHTLMGRTIKGMRHADDKVQFLLDRSQCRYPRMVAAYETMIDHPWCGVGLGAFEKYSHRVSLKQFPTHVVRSNVHGCPATNIYAEAGAESGLLGAAALLAFGFGLVGAGLRASNYQTHRRRTARDPATRDLIYLVPPLALATQLILLAAESNPYRAYVWVTIGLTMGLITLSRNQSQFQRGDTSRDTKLARMPV